MKLNAATRTRLVVDMTLTVDPTGSTPSLSVDGTWYAAEWIGRPTVAMPGRWAQSMRTVQHFAGPDFDPTGLEGMQDTVVLAEGRHVTQTRVHTAGDDVLVRDSSPVDIVRPT